MQQRRAWLPAVTVAAIAASVGPAASSVRADLIQVLFRLTADQNQIVLGGQTDVTVSVLADPARPPGQGVASWQFDLDIVPEPVGNSPLTVIGPVTFLADFSGWAVQPLLNTEVSGEVRALGAALPIGVQSSDAGVNGQYTDVARFTVQGIELGTANYQVGIDPPFEASVLDANGTPVVATAVWAQQQFTIEVVPEPVSGAALGLLTLMGLRCRWRGW